MPFPDLSQQVFGGNFAVVENQWAGGRSANAHLVLFRADGKTWKGPFHQERAEFFAIHFGEHSE